MNPYLSAVNQSLLFARLLKEQLANLPDSRHLQLAVCQSVLYQLQRAYGFHLREIAANYQCPNPEAVREVDVLGELLLKANKDPAEARELADLEGRADSWLRQLLDSFAALEAVAEKNASNDPGTDIPLREVPDVTLNAETIADWLGRLQEMVDRHRDLMYEC